MTRPLFWLAIVLLAWGLVVLIRRAMEQDAPTDRRTEAPQGDDDDEIDYEELERAEEEMRDLDVDAKPEEGFEGDDWGPGVGR